MTETRFVWERDPDECGVIEMCEDKFLLKQFAKDEMEVLTCTLESKCPCCGEWRVADNLGGIIVDVEDTQARREHIAEIEKQLMDDYQANQEVQS